MSHLPYVNTSLLAVSDEIAWRRYEFLDAAKKVAVRDGGYPPWKIGEIASSLEAIFNASVREDHNYDVAVKNVLDVIR